MIRKVLVPVSMELLDGRGNEAFSTAALAAIEQTLASYPGYYAFELDPDYHSHRLYLIMKPTDDIVMDEGL